MFACSSASSACKRKLRAPQLEMKAAARAFSVFGCTGAMISYSAQEKYPTGTSDERLVVITILYPLLNDQKLKTSVLLSKKESISMSISQKMARNAILQIINSFQKNKCTTCMNLLCKRQGHSYKAGPRLNSTI